MTKEERLNKYINEHAESGLVKDMLNLTPIKLRTKRLSKKEILLREKHKRWDEIIKLRLVDKLTLEQIANRVRPTITRERVRQILKEITAERGIQFPTSYGRAQPIITHCSVCGVEIKIKYLSQYKGEGKHRCPEHKNFRKYRNKEEAKLAQIARNKWRYKNDPAFRAARAASTMKYYNKIKNTPEFKKRNSQYQAALRKKKKNEQLSK